MYLENADIGTIKQMIISLTLTRVFTNPNPNTHHIRVNDPINRKFTQNFQKYS